MDDQRYPEYIEEAAKLNGQDARRCLAIAQSVVAQYSKLKHSLIDGELSMHMDANTTDKMHLGTFDIEKGYTIPSQNKEAKLDVNTFKTECNKRIKSLGNINASIHVYGYGTKFKVFVEV